MTVERPCCVRVPASSGNLGTGFDTLGLALALHNTVVGAPAEAPSLSAFGSESEDLLAEPASDNVLFEAVRAAYGRRGLEAPPYAFDVECRIPLARGLGSSASAAVAGLMIASRFLEPPLDRQELLDLSMGLEGHPDNVAAAIAGGLTASMVDAAGAVHLAKMRLPSSVAVLAFVPGAKLPTSEARQVLPLQYSRADVVHNLSRVALLGALLSQGRATDLWEAFDDKLHQPYRAPLVPGLLDILSEARKAGAIGGFLSGAGPTTLVLCEASDRPRLAERLAKLVESLGVPGRVMPLGIEAAGARYTRASAIANHRFAEAAPRSR